MNRRAFVILLAGATLPAAARTCTTGDTIPTDPDRLNSHADQYNLYVKMLREHLLPTQQWKRVVQAWHRLTN
jgi:hypothetical protein